VPKKRRGKASAKIIEAARGLRRAQTPAEKKLWDALRDRRLVKLKFRRQHPFGRFVLDAFCVEQQLEVEVDGDWHNRPEQAAYDEERVAFLQANGIKVVRFSNNEVLNDLKSVLRRIVEVTNS
jgi:very-short-patch-repair endonuclease